MTKKIAISKPIFNREEFLKLKTIQEKNEYMRGVDLRCADLNCLNLSDLNLRGLDFRLGIKVEKKSPDKY